MLEELKDIAFWIHIEPLNSSDHAIKVDSVIKVLSDISQSYNQYLEIEFLKNDEFRKVHDTNKKILEVIKEELNLLVVDLKYHSIEVALAPDVAALQSSLFKNEVLEWKKEIFRFYKEVIIGGDYENHQYLLTMIKRYTEEERIKIFSPLFSSFGDGSEFRVSVMDSQRKIVKTLIQPENTKEFYVSGLVIENTAPAENNMITIASNTPQPEVQPAAGSAPLPDFSPFNPDVIRYESLLFVLNRNLDCHIDYDDNNYIIRNDELDLVVWGESRKEVEDSFQFNFYWMYLNYYLEEDKNLSDEAYLLKLKLKQLIKSVMNKS